jgi:hypothetical protein
MACPQEVGGTAPKCDSQACQSRGAVPRCQIAKEHTTDSNTDAEINTKKAHINIEHAANDVAGKLHTPKHHRICHTADSHHARGVWGGKPTKIQQTNATRSSRPTPPDPSWVPFILHGPTLLEQN